jgi:hypothetical protein
VVAAVAFATVVPPAAATEWPTLDGTYTAVSDGRWAKTREVRRDEATVTSTWTITSTCSSHVECTGRVISDQGWSADAVLLEVPGTRKSADRRIVECLE